MHLSYQTLDQPSTKEATMKGKCMTPLPKQKRAIAYSSAKAPANKPGNIIESAIKPVQRA